MVSAHFYFLTASLENFREIQKENRQLLVRLVDISLGKKSNIDSSRINALSSIPSFRSLAVNDS